MFKKATRKKVFLKLAITGPSGSGKTKAALRLSKVLKREGRVAYIDTENGSASLYSKEFDFDVEDISPPFTDNKFVDAIEDAVRAQYPVIVIDSASHFWEQILNYKNDLDKSGKGSSYTNWATATDKYKKVLNSVLYSPVHLICCMRSKVDYVLEKNDKGKEVPKKVGMAAVMREGAEYEFTTVFDLNNEHIASVSKDRTELFDGQYLELRENIGHSLLNWLDNDSDETAALETEARREFSVKPNPDQALEEPESPPKKKVLPERKTLTAAGLLTSLEKKQKPAGETWGAKVGNLGFYTLERHLMDKLALYLDQQVRVSYLEPLHPNGENYVKLLGIELNSAAAARSKAKAQQEGPDPLSAEQADAEFVYLQKLIQEEDLYEGIILKVAQKMGWDKSEAQTLANLRPAVLRLIVKEWRSVVKAAHELEQTGELPTPSAKEEEAPLEEDNLEMEAVVHG